jgi:hypothetical protein
MGAIGKLLERFSNREMAGRPGAPERTSPEQLLMVKLKVMQAL